MDLSSVTILAKMKCTSLLTTFLNLSKLAKLILEDNLKLARVLLVQTKAPEAVVVVVVVVIPEPEVGDF